MGDAGEEDEEAAGPDGGQRTVDWLVLLDVDDGEIDVTGGNQKGRCCGMRQYEHSTRTVAEGDESRHAVRLT